MFEWHVHKREHRAFKRKASQRGGSLLARKLPGQVLFSKRCIFLPQSGRRRAGIIPFSFEFLPDMLKRLGRLPLTVRIPMGVAVLFFGVSTVLISLSLHGLSRQFERQVADLGQVYLDGLSAAILPAVRAGNTVQMLDVLNRALDTHVGIVDRTLAIIGPDKRPIAHVARYPEVEDIPLNAQLALNHSGTYLNEMAQGVWTWRLLDESQPSMGTVVANLDVSDFISQRRTLAIELVLVGLGVSLAGAGLSFLLARRLQRPIIQLTQQLRAARRREPQPVDIPAGATGDTEVADLLDAYNWMVQSVQEREALARRQDRLERAALLGRMSAALAHEVRNPLGGMHTALQTLRQFGHQEQARHDAIDFVERGVAALRSVVDASLKTFRADGQSSPLRQEDIDDVQLLIRSEARRKNVSLAFRNDWPSAELPLPSVPVRQILLNLVLNAIAASPSGGAVHVTSASHGERLQVQIQDQGRGMPDAAMAVLMQSGEDPSGGIGLGIVRDLVQGLGGSIAVQDVPGPGTLIIVSLPFAAAGKKDK